MSDNGGMSIDLEALKAEMLRESPDDGYVTLTPVEGLALVEVVEAARELNDGYGFDYDHPALTRLEQALSQFSS